MKFVVSFTSIPSRFERVPDIVRRINGSSYRPEKILINIPFEYKRFPDSKLAFDWEALKQGSKIPVEIVRSEDFGPATKYLNACEEYKNTQITIIVIDDDLELNPVHFEQLVENLKERPDSVIGFRGRVLPYDMDYGKSEVVISSNKKIVQLKNLVIRPDIDILTVVGSVAFQLNYNGSIIEQWKKDYGENNSIFFVDDVWLFKLFQELNKKMYVPPCIPFELMWDVGRSDSLWSINQDSNNSEILSIYTKKQRNEFQHVKLAILRTIRQVNRVIKRFS